MASAKWAATTFVVDTVNGDDEAAGDAAHPLKSQAEYLRRTGGGSGTYGSDVFVPLTNGSGAPVNAMRETASLAVATEGIEEARKTWQYMKAGTRADCVTMGWDLATFACILLGSAAGRSGIRLQGSAIELMLNGTAYLQLTGTTVNFPSALVTLQQRISEKDTTGTVSTNTLTLGTSGNLNVVSGTPTINGIVTSGIQAGYRGRIRLASGSTINHNSGAPGSGAVAVLTPTAASIGPTSSARVFPISYDGTNFFVEG